MRTGPDRSRAAHERAARRKRANENKRAWLSALRAFENGKDAGNGNGERNYVAVPSRFGISPEGEEAPDHAEATAARAGALAAERIVRPVVTVVYRRSRVLVGRAGLFQGCATTGTDALQERDKRDSPASSVRGLACRPCSCRTEEDRPLRTDVSWCVGGRRSRPAQLIAGSRSRRPIFRTRLHRSPAGARGAIPLAGDPSSGASGGYLLSPQ